MTTFHVTTATADHADALHAFAARRPAAWADFASIAATQPDVPRVWLALDAAGAVHAAAIDDGMAMSVGGDDAALAAIASHVPDVADKLVVAGRAPDVRAFMHAAGAQGRRERLEHFMSVDRATLRVAPDNIPLRIADAADLPMLIEVRAAALGEEYDMRVEPGSVLHDELATAVTRAVGLQGVAIWVEHGACAFTAQLIAKTDDAAMFGDLYCDPSLRGAGRATRALATFCAWLMTESANVVLRVGAANEPAIRLYERVGFQVIDEFCSSLREDTP